MKHFFNTLALSLTILFGMTMNACVKNPCKGVDCGTNGSCSATDGHCICNSGYEVDAGTGKCTKISLCKNVDCGAHGHCNEADGKCICDAGYKLNPATGKCEADLCYGKDCGTHGTCNPTTGSCDCDAGYELGTDNKCSVEIRNKFLGSWKGQETCSPQVDMNPYIITIAPNASNILQVNITNFARTYCGSSPIVVTANVSGNQLMNYSDTCPDVNVISGSATLSADGKTLNVTYTETDGSGTTYNCTASMTKQ